MDRRGFATGEHEGRKRALVLKERGIKKMPVIIFDEGYKDYNWRVFEPDFVIKKIDER
jgi:hypothetical protein